MKSGGWFIGLDFVLVKLETCVTELCPSNCLNINYLLKSEVGWAGCEGGCRENLQHRPEDAVPSPRLPEAMEMWLFFIYFCLTKCP